MHDFEPSEHGSAPLDEVEAEPVAPVPPEPVTEPAQAEADEDSAIDPSAAAVSESEPVLDLSYPTMPAPAESAPSEQAPPGLAVGAFKDIKPVAFGGFAGAEEAPSEPEPEAPEPVIEITAEPTVDMSPEPIADVAPEPAVAPEPETAPELEPIELIDYPLMESEPVIELEPEPLVMPDPPMDLEPPVEAAEPEPVAAVLADEGAAGEPRSKGRFKLPNPQIRLPKFSLARRSKPSGGESKGSFVNLPENLRGPLNDIERKIALGSVVAVVAAAAFGYMSAPSDDVSTTAPTTAPAAASR